MDKKGCIYTRVSSTMQQQTGYSPDDQNYKMIEWSKELEIDIKKEDGTYRRYNDVKSAKDGNRIGFKQMIEDAKKGLFKFILCLSDDRFMRDSKNLFIIMDELHLKHSVFLCFYNMRGYDIYTPDGRAWLQISQTFAERFRPTLAARTRDGVLAKIRSGQWMGRAPFGYNIISRPESTTSKRKITYLIKNVQEQNIIRIIFELTKKGKDVIDIINVLNKTTILPREQKTRDGEKHIWNKNIIKRILQTDYTKYEKYIKEELPPPPED